MITDNKMTTYCCISFYSQSMTVTVWRDKPLIAITEHGAESVWTEKKQKHYTVKDKKDTVSKI